MTTKDKEENTEKLLDLAMRIMEEINKAEITNAQEIDLIALLLGKHIMTATQACGPSGAPRVLERFTRCLTLMHPNLQAWVIEK